MTTKKDSMRAQLHLRLASKDGVIQEQDQRPDGDADTPIFILEEVLDGTQIALEDTSKEITPEELEAVVEELAELVTHSRYLFRYIYKVAYRRHIMSSNDSFTLDDGGEELQFPIEIEIPEEDKDDPWYQSKYGRASPTMNSLMGCEIKDLIDYLFLPGGSMLLRRRSHNGEH